MDSPLTQQDEAPSATTPARTCLLVLGMHRSGTSALTRTLSLMGAALPENVMGAGPGNETGHWEPQRLVSLHDRMLAEAGSSWDDWRELDLETSLTRKRLDHYKGEIRRAIEEEYGAAPLFVIKDPRICRFVGLYVDILSTMGVAVHPVLMLRNPLAVTASLGARNEIHGAQGWLYWLRHVLDAEAASRAMKRTVIFYEHLLEDWRDELAPLFEKADIDWPVDVESVAEEIDGYLSKDHRRHSFTSAEIDALPAGGEWMRRVWRAFETMPADPAAATAELDAVNLQFAPAVDLFSEALAVERAERQQLHVELENRRLRSPFSTRSLSGKSSTEIDDQNDANPNSGRVLKLDTEGDRAGPEPRIPSASAFSASYGPAAFSLYGNVLPGSEIAAKIEAGLNETLLIIPSIDGGELLERMLPSLDLPSTQVVVLDQGSSDDTERVCKRFGVELFQLHVPHTYTQACNIGLDIARTRGCKYLLVANNDIVFRTSVAIEMVHAMEQDPNLGIVAPSQMIVDSAKHTEHLAYRVFWDLTEMRFEHDFTSPGLASERIESDFCELTLALIRISVTDEIGFLDDKYGFYFEDADFGFRLRERGYSCAYLPQSQISHFHGSTFDRESQKRKHDFQIKNKKIFKNKHVRYGVNHQDHNSLDVDSWNIINIYLHKYIRKFGILDANRPSLIFSHPGTQPFDYIYTVWETTRLPQQWRDFAESYDLALATSGWVADILHQEGFRNVSFVPLGVETDVFHPWGTVSRLDSNLTYLWFANNQHRKGLDVMMAAWSHFHEKCPEARLVLMGRGIAAQLGLPLGTGRRCDEFEIYSLPFGVTIYESLLPVSAERLASIYRGVDFLLNTSRAEGFGFTIVEALACGTPAIFGNYASTAEFTTENALTFEGKPELADYSDKGFEDVGDWYEPEVGSLTAALIRSAQLDKEAYHQLTREGLLLVRNRYTWRNTAIALREALKSVQKPRIPERNYDGERDESALLTDVLGTAPEGAGSQAQMVRKNSRTSRANAFFARNFRRGGFLLNRTSDVLESQGGRAALRFFGEITKRYLRSRVSWIWLRFKSLRPRLGWSWRGDLPRVALRPTASNADNLVSHGVLFIGYVEAGLGLGETLRSMLRAASHVQLTFNIFPFNVGVESRRTGDFMPERYNTSQAQRINVITVAVDQVPNVFRAVPRKLLKDSYNVLYTFWELPKAPAEWASHLADIDEIWAPNEFVRNALAGVFEKPIHIVPPCVDDVAANALPRRDHFGLDPDRFYFLFSFDYFSSPFRKNPLGVLSAFRDAFADAERNVGLIIKSVGAEDHYPHIKDEIRRAMEEDARIVLIDEQLDRSGMLGLINCCDCYVSLHRAEGFGYGMVEAMQLGKAVVGTAFSGSAEFLREDISYPVSYTLRDIAPDEYVWSVGQQWAEPDLSSAVGQLRNVFDYPGERIRKAEAASAFVTKTYGKSAVGRIVADQIARINAQLDRQKSD
jgi:glycosyltransferase involved in cell wall biosynthesis